jgi:hydrogenase nickel incorporation protein HypA/HybF
VTVHESSLARRLLDVVLAHAGSSPACRIRTVRGWIAETEALSPESLALHFAAHAHGTPAEGARLELRLERVEARCARCARIWAPDHHVLLCPACGATDGELLGPTGVAIESLEVVDP